MKILLTGFVAMGLLMGSSVYASFESGGAVAQALNTAQESPRVAERESVESRRTGEENSTCVCVRAPAIGMHRGKW